MKNDKNAEKPCDSAETRALTRSERAAKRNAVRMAADEPSTSAPAMTVEVHDATADIIWLDDHQPGPSNAKRRTLPTDVAERQIANRRYEQWDMTEADLSVLSPVQLEVFDRVMEMFDDADGEHVIEMINSAKIVVADDVTRVVNRMLTDGYRRRAVVRANRAIAERRALLLDDAQLDIADLVKETPDPATTFTDRTKTMSAAYRQHAIVYLQNVFRMYTREVIEHIFSAQGHRLILADRRLRNTTRIPAVVHGAGSATPAKRRPRSDDRLQGVDYVGRHFLSTRRADVEWPAQIDEQFFRELQYLRNRVAVDNYVVAENERYTTAQWEGEVAACPICLEENIPETYMLDCKSRADDTYGHVLCRACFTQHAKTQINDQGQVDTVTCAQPDCEREYTMEQLGVVLPRSAISRLAARREASQLRQAGIEGIVECPFCDYLVEMVDWCDQLVFVCRNPICQRRSCMQCRRPDHVPLTCAAAMSTAVSRQIEERMAEAMIRTCPNERCQTRCIKESGCNSMHCGKCKTHFCYVCNKALGNTGYQHFQLGICSANTPLDELHGDRARRAGEEARRQILAENPEAATIARNVNLDNLLDHQLRRGKERPAVPARPIRPEAAAVWPRPPPRALAPPRVAPTPTDVDDFFDPGPIRIGGIIKSPFGRTLIARAAQNTRPDNERPMLTRLPVVPEETPVRPHPARPPQRVRFAPTPVVDVGAINPPNNPFRRNANAVQRARATQIVRPENNKRPMLTRLPVVPEETSVEAPTPRLPQRPSNLVDNGRPPRRNAMMNLSRCTRYHAVRNENADRDRRRRENDMTRPRERTNLRMDGSPDAPRRRPEAAPKERRERDRETAPRVERDLLRQVRDLERQLHDYRNQVDTLTRRLDRHIAVGSPGTITRVL